jgi:hypothetical protein
MWTLPRVGGDIKRMLKRRAFRRNWCCGLLYKPLARRAGCFRTRSLEVKNERGKGTERRKWLGRRARPTRTTVVLSRRPPFLHSWGHHSAQTQTQTTVAAPLRDRTVLAGKLAEIPPCRSYPPLAHHRPKGKPERLSWAPTAFPSASGRSFREWRHGRWRPVFCTMAWMMLSFTPASFS